MPDNSDSVSTPDGSDYVHGIRTCDKRLRSLPNFDQCHCQPPAFLCSCGRLWEHLCDEAEGCMYWCVGDFKRLKAALDAP